MNLSINLTLGNPAPDSAMNTASAAEDGTEQSFSLVLADELNERELTPPIVVDDTKAVDPKLLALIAARQKLATDDSPAVALTALKADKEQVAADSSDKDARVWLEDPLADLPAADDETAQVVELELKDKPWLDIIEKAKNYSPAMQSAKTATDDAALLSDAAADAASVITADAEIVAMPASAAPSPLLGADEKAAVATATNSSVLAERAAQMLAKETRQADDASHNTGADPLVPTKTTTAADTTKLSAAVSNVQAQTAATNATESVAVQEFAATSVPPTEIAETSQAATTSLVTAAQQQTDTAVNALQTATAENDAEAAAQLPGNAQPAATAADAAPAVKANSFAAVDKSANKAMTNPETPAPLPVAAAEGVAPSQELVTAAVAAAPIQAPVNSTTEKTPAANAFAQHMKAVNQSQAMQSQQQSSQQDPQQQTGQGQGQARLVPDPLNQNLSVPSGPLPAFSQQLQQLTEAVPVASSSQTITPVQGQLNPLASAQTNGLTKLPETGWQAPLALTEPTAAQQIKDRVMVQIQHKLQSAEVQLHPEEFGAMQIKLNLQQDQLSVQFVVQQGVAKEALEQQMPKLRELLEQQGIALTEGQVEQRQSGSQREQQSAGRGKHGSGDVEPGTVQQVQIKVSDRMVDFYA